MISHGPEDFLCFRRGPRRSVFYGRVSVGNDAGDGGCLSGEGSATPQIPETIGDNKRDDWRDDRASGWSAVVTGEEGVDSIPEEGGTVQRGATTMPVQRGKKSVHFVGR